MARTGLERGFTQANLQGIKSGHAMGGMRSGFSSGFTDGTTNNDKVQDPALLTGEKLPWIYANADYTLDTGNSTLILDPLNLPDKWLSYKNIAVANHPDYQGTALFLDGTTFVRTGETWNRGAAWVSMGTFLSSTNRAWPILEGQDLDGHVCLDMGGQTGTATGHWLAPISSNGTAGESYLSQTGTDSFTAMMVMKSKNTSGKYHFTFEDSTLPGGYTLTQLTDTSLRSVLYGNQAGAIRSSTYDTISNLTDLQDWVLVTVKCTLKQKLGPGSEQEMYVNGKLRHVFSASTWTTPEVTTTFPAAAQLTIGALNTSAPSANGMYFASFLLLPYWANESEQLRLENYFRQYYGKSF